jgi:hypothetical protein
MTVKAALDRANPNTLPDLFRQLGLGQIMRGQIPQVLRRQAPVDDAGVDGSLEAIILPDDCRAAVIHRAYARAGMVTGELAPVAYGTTPMTGEIAVAPNGNIVVLEADAITDLDVVFTPERCDVVTLDLPVVPGTGVCALPPAVTTPGVVYLIDANATAGTATGRMEILVPAAGAPGAGNARLDVAKENVQFAVADAVERATVRLAVVSAIDFSALLEAAESAP